MTVVDKATKNIDLVPYRKDVTEAGATNMISQDIVKLHGIPSTFIQIEELSLLSKFGENCGNFKRG